MTFVKTTNPFVKSFDGLMNELFNELPVACEKVFNENAFGFPPVNIIENATTYNLQIAAPGYDKADFVLKIEGNILNISVDKNIAPKADNDTIIKKEFSIKSFKRSFTIDKKIETNNIIAKYENGILNVALPKKEEVKIDAKEIIIQ